MIPCERKAAAPKKKRHKTELSKRDSVAVRTVGVFVFSSFPVKCKLLDYCI